MIHAQALPASYPQLVLSLSRSTSLNNYLPLSAGKSLPPPSHGRDVFLSESWEVNCRVSGLATESESTVLSD